MQKIQEDESNPVGELVLLHKKYSSESLRNLTKELVLALSGKGPTAANEGSPADSSDDRLDRLRVLSESWDQMVKKETINDDGNAWNRLLDACREAEIENIMQRGYGENSAKKLVRVEHAWWDPGSRRFITGSTRPDCQCSVPVIVVQREAGFTIHEEILSHLWQHPVFSVELSQNVARSPRDVFESTLESVDVIARDYDYDAWEYFPSLQELDGSDRWAAECILRGLELKFLLVASEHPETDFVENENPVKSESLAWLIKADKGQRLWKLLNSAVMLGKALNHYSTFRDVNIEEAIRRFHTASFGKKTSDAGEAIEKIISAAQASGLTTITPKKLLRWLGGELPKNSDTALIVPSPLWVTALQSLTWEKFENLVKSARRRATSPQNQ